MSETSPPVRGVDDLPERVLVVAVRAGDGVRWMGGTLALHAQRGDSVAVLVLTRPADDEEAAAREAEGRAALRVLGVERATFAGVLEGGLESRREALAAALRAALEEEEPELVYAPSPLTPGRDLGAALGDALADEELVEGRVHLYGPPWAVPANRLVDTEPTRELRRQAAQRLEGPATVPRGRGQGERDLEGFVRLAPHPCRRAAQGFAQLRQLGRALEAWPDAVWSGPAGPGVSAVISTWNKCADVRENLAALGRQTRPFSEVVVVDNASTDGTAEMIREEFPHVRLVVMPHSAYGACETFNVGFATAGGEFVAILDDDVVLPPDWLEKTLGRMLAEPASTAVVSTKIVEPEMPDSYTQAPAVNCERYMSTFRGCASLARAEALRECGGYDERLFIYGNERDLTCRLLNAGYRVLQYPGAEAFHKTPFGIKLGKRSLYYHARNAWLTMLKYAPARDLARMPWLVVTRVLLRRKGAEEAGAVTDATGTIGIARSIRETKGAWWVLTKAALSVLWNVPYCLRHRAPCRADDFELPID